MVATGLFGLSKSGLITFAVGIIFGCAFTYLFSFSASFSSSYSVRSSQLTWSGIPENSNDHSGVNQLSGPPSSFEWSDKLSHSHKGMHFVLPC